jgi:DNA-binding NarL/FixJ family response regulator
MIGVPKPSPGENTGKSHVHEISRKLDVGNRAQAALKASTEGWL